MRSRKVARRCVVRGGAALAALALSAAALSSQAAPGPGSTPPAVAGDGAPDWLVPVLRVVGDDHVVPTAGVVIAPERVLVPSEFVLDATDFLVLDDDPGLAGGGRPAEVLQRLKTGGLAVLSVPGLDREAARPATPPTDGSVVSLYAVPPAALILQGSSLVLRRTVLDVDGDGRTSIAPDRPLPNLTGALVSGCGDWVGYSAARGVASLATGVNTLYRWQPDLGEALAAAGFAATPASCDRALALDPVDEGPVGTDGPATADEVSGPGEAAAPTEVDPTPDPLATDPGPSGDPLETDPAPGSDTDNAETPETLPGPAMPPEATSAAEGGDRANSAGGASTTWSWVWAVLAGLVGLAAGRAWGVVTGRRAADRLSATEAGSGLEAAHAPGDRIETVMFLEGEAGRHPVTGVRAGEGVRVDALIGRFDAEILLADPSVSRHHARFQGEAGSLFLVDLGSTNGTAVNDRRCEPQVPMPVAAGDRIRLGRREFILRAVAS